jgi:hypothetical protein
MNIRSVFLPKIDFIIFMPIKNRKICAVPKKSRKKMPLSLRAAVRAACRLRQP